jgi:DNA polymerase III delta prime subunit
MDKEKLLKLAQQTDVASALKVMEKLGSFQAKEALTRNMVLSKLAEGVNIADIPPEILALLADEEEDVGSAAALGEIEQAVLDQADETPSLVPDDVALDIVSGAAGSADGESEDTDLAEAIAEIMAEGDEEEEEGLTEEDLKTASVLQQLGII